MSHRAGGEAGRGKPTAKRVVGNPFSEEAVWMHHPTNAPFPLREFVDRLAQGKGLVGLFRVPEGRNEGGEDRGTKVRWRREHGSEW